jgi:hypothetical protein
MKRNSNIRYDTKGETSMPRPRIYNDPADRQAAYRARTYWQKEPTQMFLAGVARSLHT